MWELTDKVRSNDLDHAIFTITECVVAHIRHINVEHLDIAASHLDPFFEEMMRVANRCTTLHQSDVELLVGET